MKDRLAAARSKIDALDRRLAALLSRRFALVKPLAALKPRVKNPARERAVLRNAAGAARRGFAAATRLVFSEIIRQSAALQAKR